MSGHGRHDYNRCTHSRIAVFFYTNQRLSQGGIALLPQHSLSSNRRRAGSSAMQQKGVLQMNYSATHTGQSRPRTSTHLLRLCLCLQWVQTSISVLLALAPCPVALRLRWHGYFEFIPLLPHFGLLRYKPTFSLLLYILMSHSTSQSHLSATKRCLHRSWSCQTPLLQPSRRQTSWFAGQEEVKTRVALS